MAKNIRNGAIYSSTDVDSFYKEFLIPAHSVESHVNGWYQVCRIGGISNFTLHITQGYGAIAPSNAVFEVQTWMNSSTDIRSRISTLAGTSSSYLITKFRLRKDSSNAVYLDVYMMKSSSVTTGTINIARIKLIGTHNAIGNRIVSLTPITEEGTIIGRSILTNSPLHNFTNRNGIYRGMNLNGIYSIDEIYDMVHNGSNYHCDLCLGDYFPTTFSGTVDGATQSVTINWMVAGFNYLVNQNGSSQINPTASGNWIALVPQGNGWGNGYGKMNTSATTTGGYKGSYMHNTLLPAFESSLDDALGGHLLSHNIYLTDTVDSNGKASNMTSTSVKLALLSSAQIYGHNIENNRFEISSDAQRFPVFNFIGTRVTGSFWLRDVDSTSQFLAYGGTSYLNRFTSGNANTTKYIYPYCLFG